MKWIQLFVFATLEVFFYSMNVTITNLTLLHSDVGGGIYIMVFGAFFGLAATWFYKPDEAVMDD